MTFTKAMMTFFGKKTPESKLAEFAEELRALTMDDKMELAVMLRAEGLEVEDPH